MRGRYVARKGGWDCHGLPVEVEVEKALGIKNKHEIEEFGIEAFNQRCRESVQRYVEDWSALTGRIGMWLDTADAYWTLNNEYIESVWWIVRQMWDRGLIYEGFKVVPYCGRCGTALSSHELGQPGAYQDVTEPSVYVRFPVDGADFDLLVWTTTPWTLVSNVAAAVGPDIEYVRVKAPDGGRDLVLAATRVADVLGDDVEVVGNVPVSDLVGLRYERPFDDLPIDPGANRVVVADFVTIEDGSGIVHLAPAFGEIDREVAEQRAAAGAQPGRRRRPVRLVRPAAPGSVRQGRRPRAHRRARRQRGGSCRSSTTRTPTRTAGGAARRSSTGPSRRGSRAPPSARTRCSARTRRSAGIPSYIKHGRFGDWLENNVDWALSRDRFWGTPLPVWRCHDCKARHVRRARSPSSASSQGGTSPISTCTGRSSTTSRSRVPSARDARIASSPCSTRGSTRGPCRRRSSTIRSRTRRSSNGASRPTSSAEAIDQTRGWFYSLLAVNTLVFDRTPYRNVVCLALIVDRRRVRRCRSPAGT